MLCRISNVVLQMSLHCPFRGYDIVAELCFEFWKNSQVRCVDCTRMVSGASGTVRCGEPSVGDERSCPGYDEAVHWSRSLLAARTPFSMCVKLMNSFSNSLQSVLLNLQSFTLTKVFCKLHTPKIVTSLPCPPHNVDWERCTSLPFARGGPEISYFHVFDPAHFTS